MKRASSTKSISLAAIGWLVCTWLGVAAAQKSGTAAKRDCQATPQCAELLNRGIKEYQQRLYPSAIHTFEKALTLSTDPRLLVLLGRTRFKLNDARGALDYYERAKSEPMSTADSSKLEQYIAEARTAAGPNASGDGTGSAIGADLSPAAPTSAATKDDKKLKPWQRALVGVAGAVVVGTAIGIGVYFGTGKPTPDFTVHYP